MNHRGMLRCAGEQRSKKPRIICRSLLVALLGLIALPGEQIRAQRQLGSLSWHYHTSALGMARGQTLRIGLFNLGFERQSPSASVIVRLIDAQGNAIGQTEETTLPHGHTCYFDFRREALPSTSDTQDRVQFRAVVHVRVNGLESAVNLSTVGASVIPSFEFLDQLTGQNLPTGDIRTVISGNASYASTSSLPW